MALKEEGYETIMVNCNPETVSTDYDTSDKLYFEPLTQEDVLNIVDKEKPEGVIVQFGGQTPLNLAIPLEKAGVPILGDLARFHRPCGRPQALRRPADQAGHPAGAGRHRVLLRRSQSDGGSHYLSGHGAPELRARRPRDGSGV